MRTNYILVDFENVQPNGIATPSDIPIKVLVFLGENQTKLPVELAVSLQSLGENAEYIQISGNGKNALDFHIAYWIGRLSEKDPNSYFHIVSKDTGFDPLVKHLRQNKVLAQRVPAISDIKILKPAAISSPAERIATVVDSLGLRETSRPRKRKTLKNSISALFMKALGEAEVEELVSKLEAQGLISFTGAVVSYSLQKENQSSRATPDTDLN